MPTYGFAGEPFESTSMLAYHRARWLDARVGRFEGMDPKDGVSARPVTWHRYLYTANNPINTVDPSGRDFDLVSIGAAVAIVGISATLAVADTPLHHSQSPNFVKGTTDVHIWRPRPSDSYGHASVGYQGDSFGGYISWWPEDTDRVYKSHALSLYHVPAIPDEQFQNDVDNEDGRQPDANITLTCLDVGAIDRWWKTFQASPPDWSTLSMNCSTVAATALRQGSSQIHINHEIWQPEDVETVAVELQKTCGGQ